MKEKLVNSFDSIVNDVFAFPKLEKYLEQNPRKKNKSLKIIHEIHGDFSHKLIESTSTFLEATFCKLYDDFYLKVDPNLNLKEMALTNHIVLVPNHQSHADYIAVTYLIYKKFKTAIHVAGGINLNIFPVGIFFRKAGAFFMRRSFHNDELYKLTFQGYLFYLLKNKKIIEFFFEGGRSRTGKLLPPKYGLFSMLLEAHASLETKDPLLFIPITLAHENLPEDKAHARELHGAKKVQEKPSQILKIFSLFNRKLGTIDVRLHQPIKAGTFTDLKKRTQEISFECFLAVGKGMPITPSSLVAYIMLEASSGGLTWEDIKTRSIKIVNYAVKLNIPISDSFLKGDQLRATLRALNNFVDNNKITKLNESLIGEDVYIVEEKNRQELIYYKNMILHHFLVPHFMSGAIAKLMHQEFTGMEGLQKYLIEQRRRLKHEFYLPSFKETLNEALMIMSLALNKEVHSLQQAFELRGREIAQISDFISPFKNSYRYIYEAYYLAIKGVQYSNPTGFSEDQFITLIKGIFSTEILHNTTVKYPESFIVPIIKNCLVYLEHLHIIEQKNAKTWVLIDSGKLNELKDSVLNDLAIFDK